MPECPITQIQLTKDNITDFALIRSLDTYYVINKAECKEFFLLGRCPMNRNDKNYLIFDLAIVCKSEMLVNMLLLCEEKRNFEELISAIFQENYKNKRQLISIDSEHRANSLELMFKRDKIISKIEESKENSKKDIELELLELNKKITELGIKTEKNELVLKKRINDLSPLDEALLLNKHELATNLLQKKCLISRSSGHGEIIGQGSFRLNRYLKQKQEKYDISVLRNQYDMQFTNISSQYAKLISQAEEVRVDSSSCLTNTNLVIPSLDNLLTNSKQEMANEILKELGHEKYSPMRIAHAFRRQGVNFTLRKTDKGIDLNLKEELGDISILRYMKGEDYASVYNLIKSGKANVYVSNSRGESLLSLALKHKNYDIINYICSKYDLSKLPQTQKVLDKILFFAVQNHVNKLAKLIFNLKKVAGLNHYSLDYNKNNILAVAIENNNKEIFYYLVANKFRVDESMPSNKRVIHYAVIQDNKDIFIDLMLRRADPYVITDNGLSIIYYAIKKRSVKIFHMLINYCKQPGWLKKYINIINFENFLDPNFTDILQEIMNSKLVTENILSSEKILLIGEYLKQENITLSNGQNRKLKISFFDRKRTTATEAEKEEQKKHKSAQPGI